MSPFQLIYPLVVVLIVTAMSGYLVKLLWWDHRPARARQARLDELAAVINDPDASANAKQRAATEVFAGASVDVQEIIMARWASPDVRRKWMRYRSAAIADKVG